MLKIESKLKPSCDQVHCLSGLDNWFLNHVEGKRSLDSYYFVCYVNNKSHTINIKPVTPLYSVYGQLEALVQWWCKKEKHLAK